MDHRLLTSEIVNANVAHVFEDGPDVRDTATGPIGAAAVEVAIESGNLMARIDQYRDHHRADIAEVPRHQNAHAHLLPISFEWRSPSGADQLASAGTPTSCR